MSGRSLLLPTLCIAVSLAIGCGDDPIPVEPPQAGADPTQSEEEPAPEGTEEVVETPAPLTNIGITIYFPSSTGPGLTGQAREIFNTSSPVERIKQILSDLFSGPAGRGALAVIPRGTRVRQVFVLDDGVAWLDLTSELKAGLEGGSHAEMMAVYSIVNSVAMNVPEVRRVGILLEGEPCETLNGHMDLRRPLPPRFNLLEDWTGQEATKVP